MTEAQLPDAAAIRAQLETTRAQFHELFASLTDADWQRRPAEGWSVRDEMWHIAWAPGFLGGVVERLTRGKGYNRPARYFHWKNNLRTRWHGRGATPQSIAANYAAGHQRLLARLERMSAADWGRGAKRLGAYRTPEAMFQAVSRHFETHAAAVWAKLDRV